MGDIRIMQIPFLCELTATLLYVRCWPWNMISGLRVYIVSYVRYDGAMHYYLLPTKYLLVLSK